LGLGIFGKMPDLRGVPFFRFSLMVLRAGKNAALRRHRGRKLPEEASEFSAFLKKYIASWAGEAGIL
jgi:hypothetical protein